jgi:hypothetical protein
LLIIFFVFENDVKNSIELTIDNGNTFDVDIIRNTNISSNSQWQPYVAKTAGK